MLRSVGRAAADRAPIRPGLRPVACRRPGLAIRSDAGFLLIEVMVSALVVGLIVVATLTGFDVANRATMIIDSKPVVISDPLAVERKLWDGLFGDLRPAPTQPDKSFPESR